MNKNILSGNIYGPSTIIIIVYRVKFDSVNI